jgi:hypothetical protein
VLAGQPPEHPVDEACCAFAARRSDAAHRLVDGGDGRHAVREDQLVGAEPQRRGDERLELLEIAVQDPAQQVVDVPAPAERSVDEIRREGAVGRRQAAAAQGVVQGDLGVGTGALHALEHPHRHQARARGGLSAAVIAAARVRAASVGSPTRSFCALGLHPGNDSR